MPIAATRTIDERDRPVDVTGSALRGRARHGQLRLVLAASLGRAHALRRRHDDRVVARQELLDRDPRDRPHDEEHGQREQADVTQDVEGVARAGVRRAAAAEAAALDLDAARRRLDDPDQEHQEQRRRHRRDDARRDADDQRDAQAELEDGQPVPDALRQPLRRRVVRADALHERPRRLQLLQRRPDPHDTDHQAGSSAHPRSDLDPIHEREPYPATRGRSCAICSCSLLSLYWKDVRA